MLPTKAKIWLFDELSRKTMRRVTPVPLAQAKGLVAECYQQIVEEFFLNGALSAHSPNPPLLAGLWTGGREIVQADHVLDRDTKEAMAAAVAQSAGCSYCEDMMTSVLHGAGDHVLASHVQYGKNTDDPRGRLITWMRATNDPQSPIVARAAFGADAAPEAIGTAFVFHYLARFVSVFMDGTPLFTPFGRPQLKEAMMRMFGVELSSTVTLTLQPGRALPLLPAAELPEDFWWATPTTHVADALARWAAAIESCAAEYVPVPVQVLVRQRVSRWAGDAMPLSRAWLEDEVAGLSAENAAFARVALLTALSRHQLDDGIIDAFQRESPGDKSLVTTVAFAAFIASRRLCALVARQAGY